MSTTAIIVTVVVLLAIVGIAFEASALLRRRHLRTRFGPEYDRAISDQPTRAAAEHELRRRERRYDELQLVPLSAQDQMRYARQWTSIQAAFVDSPANAVRAADTLVTDVLQARGYPTDDFDERVETLSVDHATTLDHYRAAHEISEANARGEATTEQLRQALVHYRELATDLLPDAGKTADHQLSPKAVR